MSMGSDDAAREVWEYIGRIRNMTKRRYAVAYWLWQQDGELGGAPPRGALSVMGAQAVRMHIRALTQ